MTHITLDCRNKNVYAIIDWCNTHYRGNWDWHCDWPNTRYTFSLPSDQAASLFGLRWL
jgi:hypothetical protein